MNNSFIEWAYKQHELTNHTYDGLPYSFHLDAVVREARKYYSDVYCRIYPSGSYVNMLFASAGHDLIEDCRVTYNDITSKSNSIVADIIYAVTNEKGKNRKERANKKYYQGIIDTPGAAYIKLCDRIANVKYSKFVESSMFNKYREENKEFTNWMIKASPALQPMIDDLNKLFE